MPIYLTESDVAGLLTMRDALRLVAQAARAIADGSGTNAPRQRLKAQSATLHVLPASLGGRLGHKVYTGAPRGAKFWFTLYAETGEMLAMIEADRLGQIRTGAASGVATDFMARANARSLGVIGTGWQAASQIEAVCVARPIERVRVWGRDPERLANFCTTMTAKLARPIEPGAGPRDVIEGADVVVTMTSASRPVFEGTWLQPGTHVNAAGSNRVTAQEIDVETVRRASIVALEDLAQARVESGDLRAASEAGVFRWLDAVRLADIVAGTIAGRSSADEITLFESLGVGIWDLAVGSFVYDAAVENGIGTPLPFAG